MHRKSIGLQASSTHTYRLDFEVSLNFDLCWWTNNLRLECNFVLLGVLNKNPLSRLVHPSPSVQRPWFLAIVVQLISVCGTNLRDLI